MGKKRYHYDSKGRFRGHSSDESPQARNLKALLIALPILIIVSMCSQNDSEPASTTTTIEAVEDSGVSGSATGAPVAVLQPPPTDTVELAPQAENTYSDEDMAADIRAAEEKAAVAREEYRQRTYVNGDPNCPRDLIEYYAQQCAEGDQSVCPLVAQCGQ